MDEQQAHAIGITFDNGQYKAGDTYGKASSLINAAEQSDKQRQAAIDQKFALGQAPDLSAIQAQIHVAGDQETNVRESLSTARAEKTQIEQEEEDFRDKVSERGKAAERVKEALRIILSNRDKLEKTLLAFEKEFNIIDKALLTIERDSSKKAAKRRQLAKQKWVEAVVRENKGVDKAAAEEDLRSLISESGKVAESATETRLGTITEEIATFTRKIAEKEEAKSVQQNRITTIEGILAESTEALGRLAREQRSAAEKSRAVGELTAKIDKLTQELFTARQQAEQAVTEEKASLAALRAEGAIAFEEILAIEQNFANQEQQEREKTAATKRKREEVQGIDIHRQNIAEVAYSLGRDGENTRSLRLLAEDLHSIAGREVAYYERIAKLADEHGATQTKYAEARLGAVSDAFQAEIARKRKAIISEFGVLGEDDEKGADIDKNTLANAIREAIHKYTSNPDYLAAKKELVEAKAEVTKYESPLYAASGAYVGALEKAKDKLKIAQENIDIHEHRVYGNLKEKSLDELLKLSDIDMLRLFKAGLEIQDKEIVDRFGEPGIVDKIILENRLAGLMADEKYFQWLNTYAVPAYEARVAEEKVLIARDALRFDGLSPEEVQLITSGEYVKALQEAKLINEQFVKWLNLTTEEGKAAAVAHIVEAMLAQDVLDVDTGHELEEIERELSVFHARNGE